MANMNRETYHIEAIALITPIFERAGYTVPTNIRVTCGLPFKAKVNATGQSKTIGQCWSPEASADAHIEIIISMTIADAPTVLATLVHEMVHAVVGNAAGHKAPFKACAIAVGLEGKMTATHAGAALTQELETISATLGEYDHAVLNLGRAKKQSTRMVKATCEASDCGMVFRTSQKWIDHADGLLDFPICHSMMEIG
jgi:hypothetical protein